MTMTAAAQRSVSADNAPLALDRLHATALETVPYDYLVVPDFIAPEFLAAVLQDYPAITHAGSFPLATLQYGPQFQQLIDLLNGEAFRAAVEEKFALDLRDRPTTFTVRGLCRKRDGKIHTDSKSKIITVLLYLNTQWDKDGGRLRVLRSRNLNDIAAEIPPHGGTLLMFRRCDHSFHGHEPFAGARKVLQMNWVTNQEAADHTISRHTFTARWKKWNPFRSQM